MTASTVFNRVISMAPRNISARRLRVRYLIVLLFSPGLTGCAVLFPPTLESQFVDELPLIDGLREEVWAIAPEVELVATGNTDPSQEVPVEMRSLHTDQEIAFLVRWPDDTRSDEFREFVWTEGADGPELTGVPDDQLALKFNMAGSMLSCMLAGRAYTDDVWHWKAARTNPAGHAQDRQFIVKRIDHADASNPHHYEARNGSAVEILWVEDQGDPLVVEIEASQADRPNAHTFTLLQPTGSQADIEAKGIWADGFWTLELKRELLTGHDDDAEIGRDELTKFAVAVFDASEGRVHANTRFVKLRLEKKMEDTP